MRVPVLVTRDEGTVYIDIMPCEEEEEQPEQGIPTGAVSGLGNHGVRNQTLAIQLAVNSVRRETTNIRYEMRENNMAMTRQFGLLNRTIGRIALSPGQRGVANSGDHNQQHLHASMLVGGSLSNAEGGDAEHDPAVMNDISARASLSPLPRNLFDL